MTSSSQNKSELINEFIVKSSIRYLLDAEFIAVLIAFTLKHINFQKKRKYKIISSPSRTQWSHILNKLPDHKFKRMYRMSKLCFKSLSEHIIAAVGIDEFKSEDYVQELYNSFPKPTFHLFGHFLFHLLYLVTGILISFCFCFLCSIFLNYKLFGLVFCFIF